LRKKLTKPAPAISTLAMAGEIAVLRVARTLDLDVEIPGSGGYQCFGQRRQGPA
jgi:hypothetical protein